MYYYVMKCWGLGEMFVKRIIIRAMKDYCVVLCCIGWGYLAFREFANQVPEPNNNGSYISK